MLDKFKAALGRASQKEPVKIAQLRENAQELGLSLEDYMINLSNQQDLTNTKESLTNTKESLTNTKEFQELRDSLATLHTEIANLKTSQPQPIQQQAPPDMFKQMESMATFITTIKGMFPQTSVTDVVKEITALRQAQNAIFDDNEGGEEESPENYAMKLIADKFLKGGSLQPDSSPEPIPTANTPTNLVPSVEKPEVVKTDDATIKQAAREMPGFVKKGIQSGEITLQQAKDMAVPAAKEKGITLTEQDVEKIYNEVKNEGIQPIPAKPSKEDSKVSVPTGKESKPKSSKKGKKGSF